MLENPTMNPLKKYDKVWINGSKYRDWYTIMGWTEDGRYILRNSGTLRDHIHNDSRELFLVGEAT